MMVIQETMIKKSRGFADMFSTFFSYVLHPLLMPFIGVFILFNLDGQFFFRMPELKKVVYILVALGTILTPLLFQSLLYFFKIIRDVHLTGQRERLISIALTTLIYGVTAYSLLDLNYVHPVIQSFVMGVALSLIVTVAITAFWKISAHMVGIGGLTGLIISLLFIYQYYNIYLTSLVLIAAGCTGFSRVYSKAHSQAQVYAGFLTGLGAILLVMLSRLG